MFSCRVVCFATLADSFVFSIIRKWYNKMRKNNEKEITNSKKFKKIILEDAVITLIPLFILLIYIIFKQFTALKTSFVQVVSIGLLIISEIGIFSYIDIRKDKYFGKFVIDLEYGREDYFLSFLPIATTFSIMFIAIMFIAN